MSAPGAPEPEAAAEPELRPDDIVISGFSGRFPGSDSVQQLRENILGRADLLTDTRQLWKGPLDLPPRVGKLNNLYQFDADFFGVSREQATVMDPQVKLLLENTYEAIVDAGLNPATLRGKNIGVVLGATFSENAKYTLCDMEPSSLGLLGSKLFMFSQWISHQFGFTGAAYSVDTACSSSLYALVRAFEAVRSGKWDAAIVGGSNAVLFAGLTVQFFRLGVLTTRTDMRPFDDSADGYVRSESVAVVLLQRARDARRAYAVLVHGEVNADGYKEDGITFPSRRGQAQLLRSVYSRPGIDTRRVSYVETHATGTQAGDPSELNALDEVFFQGTGRQEPLLVGSVKSNIGHTEPAAGLCSLAKALMVLNSDVIPPTIHYATARKEIAGLVQGRIKVVADPTPWPGGLVGVSSFGFGAANAHVVLRAPGPLRPRPAPPPGPLPRLVLASGRSEEAVAALLGAAEKQQPPDVEFIRLLHDIHAADIPGHTHRGFCLAGGAGQPLPAAIERYPGQRRPVWFVFSGLGSQWPAMGKHLVDIPIFAETVRKIDAVLAPKGLDIQRILTSEDPTIFDNIINCSVGITTVQVGLVDILRAVGIEPDGMVGHSVGELGCAYADGCLTAEKTVLAAYSEARATLEANLIPGAMADVDMHAAKLAPLCPPEVDVACHNGPDSATISGPAELLRAFVKELQAKGVFAKEVACGNIAYHSRYIRPAGDLLLRYLREVIPEPRARSPRWVSSSVPESRWAAAEVRLCSAEYQTNNLLGSVLFEEATRKLPSNAVAIEIAPHGLLQAILKRSLSPDCLNVALTKRGGDCVRTLLQALGRLYCAGLQPRPAALYPEVRYPVSRGTPMISPLVRWDHSREWPPVRDASEDVGWERKFVIRDDDDYGYMYGHVLDGRPLVPATGYIVLAWQTVAGALCRPLGQTPVLFEGVRLLRATHLPTDRATTVDLKVSVHPLTGEFEITERQSTLATGRVRLLEPGDQEALAKAGSEPLQMNERDIHKVMRLLGYTYSGAFRGLVAASIDGKRGRVRWDGNWAAFMDSAMQLRILTKHVPHLVVPIGIRSVTIDPRRHENCIRSEGEERVVDVRCDSELDAVVAGGLEVRGLQTNAISRRPPAGQPVLERYDFVAHSGAAPLELAAAVRACVQLALENGPPASRAAPPLHAVELLAPGAQPLAPLLLAAFEDTRYFQARVSLLPESGAQPPPADALPPGVSVDADAALHTVRDAAFVLLADALAGERLRDCAPVLAAGGCVLSRESRAPGPRAAELARQAGLELAFCRPLQPGPEPGPAHSLALLRKGGWAADERSLTVVHVADCDSFPWLAQLQAALREPSPAPDKRVLLVAQGQPLSGVLGLFNCLRQEPGPGRQLVRCYALPSGPAFSPQLPLFRRQLQLDLAVNVYEAGGWGSYRHLPLQDALPVPVEHAYCDVAVPGDLSTLHWMEGPLQAGRYLCDGENVLSHVCYASLNFKDIMLGIAKLNVNDVPKIGNEYAVLGFEFSGVSADGRRLMGANPGGAISNLATAHRLCLWDVPEMWTLEQAATVPVAYCTALQALEVQGRMRAGQSVLVHAGSGAVGQAAIHLALFRRCRVFATVGSADKRSFLLKRFPQLQAEDIGCSRDLSFERLVLERTAGRGVDLVLNSLAGDKLQASLRCLAEGGRFLEIGKADSAANTQLATSLFRKRASMHGVHLDHTWSVPGAPAHRLQELLYERINDGAVQPISTQVFGREEVEQAFRLMAAGKHVGKVLIRVREREPQPGAAPPRLRLLARPRYHCDPSASYVICGGLGGFGLELADWLVGRGARALLLTSRRGPETGYQARKVAGWEARGVRVRVATDDATGADGSESILAQASALGPVDAIFNLAAVLQDSLFENQTREKFREVYRCKAAATKQLDAASRRLCPRLRHFVVFSSVACGRGNAGQTNYGLANAVMERVVRARHAAGLPATAVQWGAVGDVGLVADMRDSDKEIAIAGTLQQSISSCLEVMDGFLSHPHAVLSSMVLAEKRSGAGASDVVASVASILGIRDLKSVSAEVPLSDLGLDSMAVVEIQQALERDFGILMTPQELRSVTFARLASVQRTDDIGVLQGKQKSSGKGDAFAMLALVLRDAIESEEVEGSGPVPLWAAEGPGAPPPLLMLPGGLGVAASLRPLAANLRLPAVGLPLASDRGLATVSQLLDLQMPAIEAAARAGAGADCGFRLLGYSFGGLLALEAAARMEAAGPPGHVLLVDAAPLYSTSGVEQEAPGRDPAERERSLNERVASAVIDAHCTPAGREACLASMRGQGGDWELILPLLGELVAEGKRNRFCWLLDAGRARALATLRYRWEHPRLRSRVTLLRIAEPPLPLPADYGLGEVCESVQVLSVQGADHLSIVRQRAAADLLRAEL